MACRLREEGERVGLLALVDIAADPSPGGPGAGGEGEGEDDPALLARALGEVFPVVADELRGLGDRAQLDALLARARAAGRLPADLDRRRAEALFAVFKANLEAARRFRPRRYPGEALVVRAAGSDRFAAGDPGGGWDRLAARTRLATVPGDHHSLVRPPHVAALAEVLENALAAAGG
jgi:thioesterase domain-containing protein